jgi:hypothetical protein
VRIDRSDPADGPGDAHVARRAQPAPDDPDSTGKENGKAVGDYGPPDSSPAHQASAFRVERTLAHRAVVDAEYRQYDIDHAAAGVDKLECETVETPQVPGGDVPDDPRNYSNPKTGRCDASWCAYDRAIAAAREHAGGDLGPNSIKMYDYSPATGEGTGTLIGEQTPDRLRGWRIDGQDGHVNWWDWTGGKKGAGGVYGHDWFPEDPSVPGSRYIGWAPWQDSDGNILEGN